MSSDGMQKKWEEMEKFMQNLKLVWALWALSLFVTIVGIFLLELNGETKSSLFIYWPIGFLFISGYFVLLIHSRRINQKKK